MSNENCRGPGPSRETLTFLKGMMPTMGAGLSRGKVTGRGKPVFESRARKRCPGCNQLWDYAMLAANVSITVRDVPCEPCQKCLDDGGIIFSSPSRCARVKSKYKGEPGGGIGAPSEKLLELRGKVVQLEEKAFDKLEEMFNVKGEKKEENNGNDAP